MYVSNRVIRSSHTMGLNQLTSNQRPLNSSLMLLKPIRVEMGAPRFIFVSNSCAIPLITTGTFICQLQIIRLRVLWINYQDKQSHIVSPHVDPNTQ